MLTLLQGFVFQNWLDGREAFKYLEFRIFPILYRNHFDPRKISHTRVKNGVFAQSKVWNGLKSAVNGPKEPKGCK